MKVQSSINIDAKYEVDKSKHNKILGRGPTKSPLRLYMFG